MRLCLRLIAQVLALGVTAFPAAAEAERVYRSAEHAFQMKFPQSWQTLNAKAPGTVISYGRASRRATGDHVITSCNVTVSPAPSTKGKEQAQINRDVEEQVPHARANLGHQFGEISEVYTRSVHYSRALVLVTSSSEYVYGKRVPLTRQVLLFFKPGLSFGIFCQATSQDFQKAKLLFDLIADSFRFD